MKSYDRHSEQDPEMLLATHSLKYTVLSKSNSYNSKEATLISSQSLMEYTAEPF
jgi:hypothetical protein